MRSGGDSRLAGVMLAAATAAVMIVGQDIIGVIPVMVVGSLIFFLGFDLLREALMEPWGKVNRLEYLTVSLWSDRSHNSILILSRSSSLLSQWELGILCMAFWWAFLWLVSATSCKRHKSPLFEGNSMGASLIPRFEDIQSSVASYVRLGNRST